MTKNSTEEIVEANYSDLVFQNLSPALLQSFAVILIGYISGHFEYVPKSQCGGLASYVGKVALPALLFQKMATLSFGLIDWLFWCSVLLGKGFVFILVFGLTVVTGGARSLGRAAIFAMFASQSNDFALGYPLFVAMYKNTYPELPEYLYLFGPISLVCLNPFGFLVLETEKNDQTESSSRWIIVMKIAKGLVTNPLVLSVAVGIAVNLITNQKLPDILAPIIQVLSDSFSATALFYLGISLVGKMQNLSGFAWTVPLLLISSKQFLVPLSVVVSVNLLKPGAASNMTDVYSNYGFLYGMIPTTPSVFLYATQYGVSKEVVAPSLFLCTVFSGPAMFVTAVMALLPSMERKDYEKFLATTSFCVSCVAIVSSVLLLVFFVLRRCIKTFPHKITINLVIAQILACLGVITCFFLDSNSLVSHICKYLLLLMGVFASYMWTAALAVGLCILRTQRSSLVQSFLWIFYLYGWGCPFCLVIIWLVVEWPYMQDDVTFDLKNYQALMSTILLVINIFLTVSSLVITWKYDRFRRSDNVNTSSAGQPSQTTDVELVSRSGSATGGRSQELSNGMPMGECTLQVPENSQEEQTDVADPSLGIDRCPEVEGDSHQLGRHLTLLLYLTGCMAVSFVLNVWKQSSQNNYLGTLVQLDFMDKILTFGQGCVTLFIFGLDRERVFLPAYGLFRGWFNSLKTSRRSDEGIIKDEITIKCKNFMERYHRTCSTSIEDNSGKFQGTKLMNWLREEGLFRDHGSAKKFSEVLRMGRAIRRVDGKEESFDSRCYYLFAQNEASSLVL